MFKYIYIFIRKYLLKIDDRSALEIAIANGMKVGENPNFQDGVIYDPSHSWLISIGNNVTMLQGYIFCAMMPVQSAFWDIQRLGG